MGQKLRSTDTMGQVTTIGGASNHAEPAAALKDIINLYRKDLSLSNR